MHPLGCINGHAARADRLASQIHEPRVVADVRVSQENAVWQPAVTEHVDLSTEVWRRIKYIRSVANPVDETKARHSFGAPFSCANRGTQGLLTREMRNARILRDAQYDQLPICRRRGL